MTYLNPYHGLELYPDHDVNSRGNENGIYFLAHLLMLKSELEDLDSELIVAFKSICLEVRAYNKEGEQVDGIYDRGSGESLKGRIEGKHVRAISHDNLSGISCGSIITGAEFHKDIANFGIKRNMRFDNANPEDPRILFKDHKNKLTTSFQFHPRDIFFWLYFGSKAKSVFLLWPIYAAIQILDMISPKRNTSAKLLGILRLNSTYEKSYGIRILRAICFKILKMQYGADFLPKIYKIYFWQENHPLPKLAYKLFKYRELGN